MKSDKIIFLCIPVLLSLPVCIPSYLSAGEQLPVQKEPAVEISQPAEKPQESGKKKIIHLEPSASCISSSCHETMGKKKFPHAVGVNGNQCIICHQVVQEGIHTFSEIGPVTRPLCAKCHSKESMPPPEIKKKPPVVITGEAEMILHKPFQEGRGNVQEKQKK